MQQHVALKVSIYLQPLMFTNQTASQLAESYTAVSC